jgi:hypothetical protein
LRIGKWPDSRDREIFHAARNILSPIATPMLAAVEEYASACKLLGEMPLLAAVQGGAALLIITRTRSEAAAVPVCHA